MRTNWTWMIVLAVTCGLFFVGCDDKPSAPPTPKTPPAPAKSSAPATPDKPATSDTPPGTQDAPATSDAPGTPPTDPAPSAAATTAPRVAFETSMGTIVLELNKAKAPITVSNFLKYVDDGHYDGTIFHRVIDQFMIQGGGFDADMKEKATRGQIQNEAANGLKNLTGTVAMARTPNPHSASSQFFINVADNAALDFRSADAQGYGYCVFGKVVSGMDVVNKMKAVKTTTVAPHRDVPVTPIVVISAKRVAE